jgi:hypothetical protein
LVYFILVQGLQGDQRILSYEELFRIEAGYVCIECIFLSSNLILGIMAFQKQAETSKLVTDDFSLSPLP